MIGYYVHHHGSGHLHRARAIALACRTPVTGFSSLPEPPGWPGEWVRLPRDDDAPRDADQQDVTAGGTLHWVPRHDRGLAARAGLVSAALATGAVRVLVVDVSVEIAVLARLHGVPVVVVAQPGDRTDRPHRTAYDLADRLLAPWPARPSAGWPPQWQAKTVHLGAVSRYDGRAREVHEPGRRVLALWGTGGTDVDAPALAATVAATPGWQWQVAGPPPPAGSAPPTIEWIGWRADVWPLLCRADVVVTHAGQNAVAEVAAARRPAVVVAQERPHAEQRATTATLRAAGIAVALDAWPDPAAWPALLDGAAARGGDSWQQWSDGYGARRAATVLDELAA